MSDPKREQHPLLRDDLSDNEYQFPESPRYHRRLFSNSGRAKYHIRGAASIIKHWPDHMSSLLTYWWMGLAMIGFTVFIIYNSVLAVAVIPTPSKLNKMTTKVDLNDENAFEYTTYRTVNMHIVVNDLSIDLNNYLPYIEIVSKNHPAFKYNFIVFLNDTFDNLNDIGKDYTQRNEVALNSLWQDKNSNYKLSSDSTIQIEYKSLSRYMNESPLKKVWKHLPQHFFGFIIRCIAIWNKGGISINPELFTPKSPHPHYIEKINGIFKSFEDTRQIKKLLKKGYKGTKKIKKKLNNIRDIIEALENGNPEIDERQKDVNLVVEENKLSLIVDRNNTQLPQRHFTLQESNSTIKQNYKKRTPHTLYLNKDLNDIKHENNHETNVNLVLKNNTKYQKLFPMFLKFLFEPSSNNHSLHDTGYNNDPTVQVGELNGDNLKPKSDMISEYTPEKGNYLPERSSTRETYITLAYNHDLDLNVDLKGNIVATKSSCHAFLGTIFNSAIHHIRDESVTDFIIAELSMFCKGTWTVCKGVDVILL